MSATAAAAAASRGRTGGGGMPPGSMAGAGQRFRVEAAASSWGHAQTAAQSLRMHDQLMAARNPSQSRVPRAERLNWAFL